MVCLTKDRGPFPTTEAFFFGQAALFVVVGVVCEFSVFKGSGPLRKLDKYIEVEAYCVKDSRLC